MSHGEGAVFRMHSPSGKCRARSLAFLLTVAASLLIPCLGSARAQTQAEQLFKEAQAARAQGNLALAEQKYLEVTRLAPGLARGYHNLGIVYFTERKYRDAAPALERAVKLDPRLPGVHVVLGLVYYELYESEKAVAAFKAALRLNPADANALLYLGKSQIQAHRYRDAAETLEKLSRSKSTDPDVYYNLSVAYMKLMLESVGRLGEISPGSYQFWLLLAQDAEARRDEQGTIRNYEQALRVKSDAVGAHYGLGSAYARAGRYDDAAEEFKKELEINPNDSLALWKLGELALRTDPEQARQYLEHAVALDPDFPQAVLAYGRALARTGETDKAIQQFRRVASLAPEEDSVHYQLANAYRRLGQREEASKELARFEELAKNKDERTQQMARRLIDLTRAAQPVADEPEPGFSPARDPTHH